MQKQEKDNLVNIHINETLGFEIYKVLNDDFILMKGTENNVRLCLCI